MVWITCNLCHSSCECYFTHCSTSLCDNKSCIANSHYRLHDRILKPSSAPLREQNNNPNPNPDDITKDNPIVQFIDHVADNDYNIFEPINMACAPNCELTRLGYDEKGNMMVQAEAKGVFETVLYIPPVRFTSPSKWIY